MHSEFIDRKFIVSRLSGKIPVKKYIITSVSLNNKFNIVKKWYQYTGILARCSCGGTRENFNGSIRWDEKIASCGTLSAPALAFSFRFLVRCLSPFVI